MQGNYKTYVKSIIQDDTFLTFTGVVGAFANGFTRFFWNIYFKHTGLKMIILTMIAFSTVVYATIRFSVVSNSGFQFEIFLINTVLGGYLGTAPTIALYLYGASTGANIYGIYFCTFACANFIAESFVSELSASIGFNDIIYIVLGMSLATIPAVVFVTFRGPWFNST
jgi:hypothetical protein